MEGNGKLETSRALSHVTGSALGGGLVEALGAATALVAASPEELSLSRCI